MKPLPVSEILELPVDERIRLERAIGEWLLQRGYDVISVDKTKAAVDRASLARIIRRLTPEFPLIAPKPVKGNS
jgi:hypothetical protein